MRILVLLLALLLIPSCTTRRGRLSDAQITDFYGDGEKARKIRDGIVWIGMKDTEAIHSWGQPNKINRSIGSWGVHEQWVYRRGRYEAQYLYFEDGILKSIQD